MIETGIHKGKWRVGWESVTVLHISNGKCGQTFSSSSTPKLQHMM